MPEDLNQLYQRWLPVANQAPMASAFLVIADLLDADETQLKEHYKYWLSKTNGCPMASSIMLLAEFILENAQPDINDNPLIPPAPIDNKSAPIDNTSAPIDNKSDNTPAPIDNKSAKSRANRKAH